MASANSDKYRDQIHACLRTWYPVAQKSNIRTLFFGGYALFPECEDYINLPGVQEDYLSAFDKCLYGLEWAYENIESSFYFLVGTDNYVNCGNLLHYLAECNPEEKLYIGLISDFSEPYYKKTLDGRDITFISGGGGIILSRASARIIINNLTFIMQDWRQVCIRNKQEDLLPACDVAIAYYFDKYNVPSISDNRFNNFFHHYRDLDTLICCHYMDPNQMDWYHKYVQHDELLTHIRDKRQRIEKNNVNLTIVTAFFDLTRRNLSEQRGFDTFKPHIEKLLSIDAQFVIYTEMEYIKEISNMVKHDKAMIIPLRYEDLEYYPYLGKIQAYHQVNPIRNLPDKFTPHHIIIEWSKLSLVKQAIKLNPYNSTHFGWVDIGIHHVGMPKQLQDLTTCTTDQVKMLMMRDFTIQELLHPNYFEYRRGEVAGGLAIGSKENMLWFYETCNTIIQECLSKNRAPAEEAIYACAISRDFTRFTFYYGDYVDIVENYAKQRQGMQTVIYCINACFRYNNKCRIIDICERLYLSWKENVLQIKESDLEYIFDVYITVTEGVYTSRLKANIIRDWQRIITP